jgi:hypothetical protein
MAAEGAGPPMAAVVGGLLRRRWGSYSGVEVVGPPTVLAAVGLLWRRRRGTRGLFFFTRGIEWLWL